MLKSMTAYGRATAVSSIGRVVVEIQSVNRKFLEIHLNMPKELRRFEMDIRKQIAREVVCGQVNINVLPRFQAFSPVSVAPNLALARDLHKAWQQIAAELNVDFPSQFSLSLLAQADEILIYDEDIEHDDQYKQLIQDALSEALRHFTEMRVREGQAMLRDLTQRLSRLDTMIGTIAAKSEGAPQKYRDKLAKRLEEALPGCLENEDKLLRELLIYSDKVDVSEEITRFCSHLEQFDKLVHSSTPGVGKAMDFIIQELGREINTLGSKSPDLEVSHVVVNVKTELAKIREQVQNIE